MSNPVDSGVSAFGEFQARFGISPGTQDAKAACEKWQSLCEALLKEKELLRADLNKTQVERDAYKSLYRLTEPESSYNKEEIMAQIGKQPPLEELIAELEQEAERQK